MMTAAMTGNWLLMRIKSFFIFFVDRVHKVCIVMCIEGTTPTNLIQKKKHIMKIQTVVDWHKENPMLSPYVTEDCRAIRKRGFVVTHQDSRMFVKTKREAESLTERDFSPRTCEPWEYMPGLSNLEAMQN